jgi:hypothetical protein
MMTAVLVLLLLASCALVTSFRPHAPRLSIAARRPALRLSAGKEVECVECAEDKEDKGKEGKDNKDNKESTESTGSTESADMAPVAPVAVDIQYCTGCRWMLRSAWLAQELLSTFEKEVCHRCMLY